MIWLHGFLRIEGALCALFGLWSHGWPLILAGAGCWAVMPLIRHDLEKEARSWERS